MFTESIANWLDTLLGDGYLVIAYGLMPGVPLVGLIIVVVIAHKNGYGQRFGLQLGFAVAVWASLCWIVVPWCGGYPNLPGLLIGWVLFGKETWGQEISIHVTNLILYPFIGWLLFRVGSRRSESRGP